MFPKSVFKNFESILINQHLLTKEAWTLAQSQWQELGYPNPVLHLLDKELISFSFFKEFISKHLKIKSTILDERVLDKTLVDRLGRSFIFEKFVIPLAVKEIGEVENLALGMVNPMDQDAIHAIEKMGFHVVPILISLPDFRQCLEHNRIYALDEVSVGAWDDTEFPIERYGQPRKADISLEPKPSVILKTESPSPYDHQLFGSGRQKFREEILATLEFFGDRARFLTKEKYSRQSLHEELRSIAPPFFEKMGLEKFWNSLTPDQKVEALANALIDKGVLTRRDIITSAVVSTLYSKDHP